MRFSNSQVCVTDSISKSFFGTETFIHETSGESGES